MEVRTDDTASWITIKSNLCKMFPFDSFKRFSDLVEYIEGGKCQAFPISERAAAFAQVLQCLLSRQREAGDNGKGMESPIEA